MAKRGPRTTNPFDSLSARNAQRAKSRSKVQVQFRQGRVQVKYQTPKPTTTPAIYSKAFTVDKPWQGQAPQGFNRQARMPTGLTWETERSGRARSYVVNPAQTSGRPNTPRSLRYGYDSTTRTLRVVFRDGTPWEYYDVSPDMARDLRRAASVGQFIIRRLDPRGPATYGPGSFSPEDNTLEIIPE